MNKITATAALTIGAALSACGDHSASNMATEAKTPPKPVVLSCDIKDVNPTQTFYNNPRQEHDIAPDRIDIYRIDEVKNTIEIFDRDSQVYKQLCEGKCTFKTKKGRYEFSQSVDNKDRLGVSGFGIDRYSGVLSGRYTFHFMDNGESTMMVKGEVEGSCERSEDGVPKPRF